MSSQVKTKDSQWLQVEICQEFLMQTCVQNDDCKYAHPLKHVEVENGKVVACYDSFKGRCTREICKFYHPTSLLMEELMMKGRSNLVKTSDQQIMMSSIMVPSVYPEFSGLQVRSPEASLKRSAGVPEFSLENLYSSMMCKRPAIENIPFPLLPPLAYQPVFQFPTPSEREFFF